MDIDNYQTVRWPAGLRAAIEALLAEQAGSTSSLTAQVNTLANNVAAAFSNNSAVLDALAAQVNDLAQQLAALQASLAQIRETP